MNNESTSDEPQSGYRSFTDSKGVQWLVWKVAQEAVSDIRSHTAPDSPSLGKAWLVFMSLAGETRRVTPVPVEWKKLPDAELEAILVDAKPFERRT